MYDDNFRVDSIQSQHDRNEADWATLDRLNVGYYSSQKNILVGLAEKVDKAWREYGRTFDKWLAGEATREDADAAYQAALQAEDEYKREYARVNGGEG